MKVRVTWHRAAETIIALDFPVNQGDPHKDDHELQFAKAIAAAQVHFKNTYGESPLAGQLEARLLN